MTPFFSLFFPVDGHAETFALPPDDIREHQGPCGHVSMTRNVFGQDPPGIYLD
jgi:hypothetical protein